MMSPSTFRDEEHFTLKYKTKAGCGDPLPGNNKRVSFGGVKLDSVGITPKGDSGKVQRTDNICMIRQQAFRRLQARFLDGIFDQISVVCIKDLEWKKNRWEHQQEWGVSHFCGGETESEPEQIPEGLLH